MCLIRYLNYSWYNVYIMAFSQEYCEVNSCLLHFNRYCKYFFKDLVLLELSLDMKVSFRFRDFLTKFLITFNFNHNLLTLGTFNRFFNEIWPLPSLQITDLFYGRPLRSLYFQWRFYRNFVVPNGNPTINYNNIKYMHTKGQVLSE